MSLDQHRKLIDFIWRIADNLRGVYKPPDYRKVMLPLIVLRRLDLVLEDGKEAVRTEHNRLKLTGLSEDAISGTLTEFVRKNSGVRFFNTSPYTFKTLLDDPNGLADNLTSYINSFSLNVRNIFEKFKFNGEINTLEEKNRLYSVISNFASPQLDLHPARVSNLQMGYIFEHLIRRFNEQANEEAGAHFTPREVITLMAHLLFTNDDDIYKEHIAKTIYDPACGTGGMLSVSEEYIRRQNPDAHLKLYGQDYNDESWAICCSDMLIKGESVDNIALGDVLGDGKSFDRHSGMKFDYMMANPPYGVNWSVQKSHVTEEHERFGFQGRFGPGLPRVNDGSLLFLLHMLSKRRPSQEEGGQPGDGSKIAIVFNGSPLFSGEAGSGESNIRRWIIENDWLDAIVALPNQLFYNTPLNTFIWLVTNRKPPERRGLVQLIDATRHFQRMQKSLGGKRNELSDEHIEEIVRLYGDCASNGQSVANGTADPKEHICSKIFPNQAFGYLKLIIERPLRLNYQASFERIERFKESVAFAGIVKSRTRKDGEAVNTDKAAGLMEQESLLAILGELDPGELHLDRASFETALLKACRKASYTLKPPMKKALTAALAERDPEAAIVRNNRGEPEPDLDLRDSEIVPLPEDAALPLPLDYGSKTDNSRLVELMRPYCDDYFRRKVKPYWPDAWINYGQTKLGYEIPFGLHFYAYEPQRTLESIEADIAALEQEIADLMMRKAK